MRKKYQWFKDLPEEEKEMLRDRWHNLSPERKQEIRENIRNTPTGQRNNLNLNQQLLKETR